MVLQYKISHLTPETNPEGGVVEYEGPDGLPYSVPIESIGYASDMVYRQNAIINGGFEFAQRQDPATLTTYSGISNRAYCADRWSAICENADVQYARVDTGGTLESGLNSRYYGRLVKITNGGKMGMYQIIEHANCTHLLNRELRISVKLKMAVAATMDARVYLVGQNTSGTEDAVPAALISSYNGDGEHPTWGTNMGMVAIGEAVTLTTAWQEVSFSLTANNSFAKKNLILVIITDNAVNASEELMIAEAGVYLGPGPVKWQNESLTLTLCRCQRYFCKTFPIDQVPVSNAGLTGSLRFIAGKATTGAQAGFWQYPVRMRTTPTFTTYNPSTTGIQVRDATSSTQCTGTTLVNADDGSAQIDCAGSASTAIGNKLNVHITADAEL